MSWTRIFVHLVFTTKDRTHLLNTPELRHAVFTHILENAIRKNIHLDCVNGYSEHAHCLLALGKEQSISEVAQLIKGESSYWINKNKLIRPKFMWQDDYWAISVCDDHLQRLREYIASQEEHHRKKTFAEELEELFKKYGLERG